MGRLGDVVRKIDSKIPWQTLTKRLPPVVIGLAVCGLCARHVLHKRIQNKLGQTDFVKESLELVKGYKYTAQLIGSRLSPKPIPLRSDFMEIGDTVAKFMLPVCGNKGCVTVYSWSRRDSAEDSWRVHKLDMESRSGERWTFYDTDTIWGANLNTSSDVKLDRPADKSPVLTDKTLPTVPPDGAVAV